MARPKSVRAPSAASLPNNLRIPSTTPSLAKTLGKLSRQSLLDLALLWLSEKNVRLFPPFLEQDEAEGMEDQDANPYPAAQTIDEVREAYEELRGRKGGKREVIDRILEGDWRHGITLGQLAMVDLRYLDDHPTSQKWTALKLVPADKTDRESTELSASLPRLHAVTFISNLHREISPLVKAHYYLSRSRSLPLTFLRIFVTDSPYQYPRHSPEAYIDTSRIIYVAFPDSSPFIYTSMSPTIGTKATASNPLMTDSRTLQRVVRDGNFSDYQKSPRTPRAPGPGRTNMANGAFSIFADAVVEGTPLDPRLSNTVSPEEYRTGRDPATDEAEGKENAPPAADNAQRTPGKKSSDSSSTREPDSDPQETKRRKLAVCSRFGTSGTAASSATLDRLDIRLFDPPSVEEGRSAALNDKDSGEDGDENDNIEPSQPTLSLTFTGTDVIAGIRKLAEFGVIDPDRMPSWMTGEEGVSSAMVRRGKRITVSGVGKGI
ncbi:CHL4 family chromosome segregation protein [Rasamsonia emersonii CBS 393.64]|uniref:CHL4 family chromosome segregation protein n=1 Tax=Rasamsonia emersonii (strain ATCC 16479 / CBS 393.64 / IMI 116815) TaxID=1408163 RepID=A0A0F4Z6V2_RASE3|nr:CHL4 family chromosome segregation protein [Rasamsonia emersonii CBS 393.64]KKA25608.1 CHL4 family chromosome segregation protein [Rasamsonia emersonii CBS 393.64]